MAELEILVTPGLKDLAGRESSVDELANTLAGVDRNALVRHSVRVLNGGRLRYNDPRCPSC